MMSSGMDYHDGDTIASSYRHVYYEDEAYMSCANLDPLMATATPHQVADISSTSRRPRPSQTSRSFTRLEPAAAQTSPPRNRASTLQERKTLGVSSPTRISSVEDLQGPVSDGDIFAQSPIDVDEKKLEEPGGPSQSAPLATDPVRSATDFVDELPIELISLTDR